MPKTYSALCGVMCTLIAMTAAGAEPDAAAYEKAAHALNDQFVSGSEKSAAPRIKDKRTAELIGVLSDSERFLASVKYQAKDIGTLGTICELANKAMGAYLFFDAKKYVTAAQDSPEFANQFSSVTTRNSVEFQDELGRLQPFVVKCLATQLPLLSDFSKSLGPDDFTETRRAGLTQMRIGVFNMFAGILTTLQDARLSETYKLNTLRSLATTASVYSQALPKVPRKALFNLAKAIEPHASAEALPMVKEIEKAMESDTCENLCLL